MRSYNASRTPNVTLGSKDAQGLTVEAALQRLDRRLEASRGLELGVASSWTFSSNDKL